MTDEINKLIEERVEAFRLELLSLAAEKPTYKAGAWNKDEDLPALVFIAEDLKDGFRGYGFGQSGGWSSECNWYKGRTKKHLQLATPKEVEDHLKKEVEKRGIKAGTTIYRSDELLIAANNTCNHVNIKANNVSYSEKRDALFMDCYCIYCKGIWASVSKDEPIKIGSYTAEYSGSCVSFNGVSYSKDYITEVRDILIPDVVKSVNVGCTGQYKLTLEDITKILKGFK